MSTTRQRYGHVRFITNIENELVLGEFDFNREDVSLYQGTPLPETLNSLGEEGWFAVRVVSINDTMVIFFCKGATNGF